MRLETSGVHEIDAPVAAVWSNLNDPTFVAAAAAGVESVEPIDATQYRVVALLGVGSISLRFTLHVQLHDIEPLVGLRMSVQGAAPGSAMRVEAAATLTSNDLGATRLAWTVASDVHGKIVSIGARMLQGAMRRRIEAFWTQFAESCVTAAS
ncbi:MAG: carbon monoxide dehydrogenase subunit G [Gemmatimonadetes bacterium]|nr:carbon monoxide dehydrogenase subunit G [Gemmatimonadota bacterium]